jgi:COMM domain
VQQPPLPAPASPGLHSLGGDSAPPGVAADLRRVLALPASAQQRIWEVLGPSLRDPVPPGAAEQVARFCAEHGVREAELAPAIRASRFLLRGAATEDLTPQRFAEDLAVLAGEDSAALTEVLLPGYEAARAHLRGELLRRSLADHGKTLEGAEWRLDVASASSRGKNLRVPIVNLTLSYREADRAERLTLQLTPDMVQYLRTLLDRIDV